MQGEILDAGNQALTHRQQVILDEIVDLQASLSRHSHSSPDDFEKCEDCCSLLSELDGAVMKAVRAGLERAPVVRDRFVVLRATARDYVRKHGKRVHAERGAKPPFTEAELAFRRRIALKRDTGTSVKDIYRELSSEGIVSGSYEAFRKRIARIDRE